MLKHMCMFTHTRIQEHSQELVHTCTYRYAHTCAVSKHSHMSAHMDICTCVQFLSMITFWCTCIYLHSWTFWAWSHGGTYAWVDPNMTTCGYLCTCSHSCNLQGLLRVHLNARTHLCTISKHSYRSVHILICKCESSKYGHCGSSNENIYICLVSTWWDYLGND